MNLRVTVRFTESTVAVTIYSWREMNLSQLAAECIQNLEFSATEMIMIFIITDVALWLRCVSENYKQIFYTILLHNIHICYFRCYMFRPWISAIFRDLRDFSTYTVYLATYICVCVCVCVCVCKWQTVYINVSECMHHECHSVPIHSAHIVSKSWSSDVIYTENSICSTDVWTQDNAF